MGPNGGGNLVLQDRGTACEDVVEGKETLKGHIRILGAAEAAKEGADDGGGPRPVVVTQCQDVIHGGFRRWFHRKVGGHAEHGHIKSGRFLG